MSAQILVNFGKNCFEFSISKTGQLDFEGKIENSTKINFSEFQKIEGSTYFSPAYYIFLNNELNFSPEIYVSSGTNISNKDIFDFLVHVGALLGALEAKDSMLAGELYLRRKNSFEKFSRLTEFILEPLCAEILFSLIYGKLNNIKETEIPLIYNIAKKKIKFNSSKENLEQAFMRYFKENYVSLSLSVVGNAHHSWNFYSEILGNIPLNFNSDFVAESEKFKKAKQEFYSSLKVKVQAEPYNKFDENAIAVMIEDIDSKLSGNSGFMKAGYIRATAAEIIRKAKEEKLSYSANLVRLSGRDIVVQVNI